jgi:putative membrane protein
VAEPERRIGDDAKRTYLAEERTLLAWWRSGLAALAVAIAVGRLVPALLHVSPLPFVLLGIGYGLVGLALVVMGARRDRAVRSALSEGGFEPLDGRAVLVVTVALVVLGAATLVLLALET